MPKYPIEFFNELQKSEQYSILIHALREMRRRKVSEFTDDALKEHLYLTDKLQKFLAE